MAEYLPQFDIFLSHAHTEAGWVENLAQRLEDELAFRVWLDKWVLTPGKSWQQEMAKGLDEAASCAVCIGKHTPSGWFRQEIERALDIQTKNNDFRVIPVLLPEASPESIPQFLSLRTWADFRADQDQDYAFHVLVQGIRGQPVGRWQPQVNKEIDEALETYERKLKELKKLKELGLHEEVVIEFERKILNLWFEGKE